MAATVQSVSTTDFTSSTTVIITKPTGLVAGDLLICHYTYNDVSDTMNTLSGWTHEVSNVSISGNNKMGVQWKVASSGDAAATNFTFTMTGTSSVGGALYRIDGFASSDLLNDSGFLVVNDFTPTFTNTITPLTANNLLLMLVSGGPFDATPVASAYAIVTSNPTWTQRYVFGDTGKGMTGATASRSASTATGDSSMTWDNGTAGCDSYCVLIAIGSSTNITVSPAVITTTITVQAPTVTASTIVSPAVITTTITVQAPTITIGTPKFTNISKHSASITNRNKS